MAAPSWTELREGALNAIKFIQESGKSVTYNGRNLSMADLPELRGLVDWYDQKIREQGSSASRSRLSYVTPVV